MTLAPDQRAWMTRMADQWSARAAALRQEPGRSAAVRAAAVQGIVDEFRRRLTTGGCTDRERQIERLAKLIAGAQPRPGPHGLTINGGSIMDAVRHRLACQLATLRNEPQPAPLPSFREPLPPPEPLPFTAGPQLDLFSLEIAA